MSVPYRILRPLLFATDPERAHRLTGFALKWIRARGTERPVDSALGLNLWGINFANPVGLAAGFDKTAELIDPLLRLGFGFIEVGSITPHPQQGNPRPRIFRLKEDEAVVNRMGFNNDGHAAALRCMKMRKRARGIVGVNLGANRESSDPVADYVKGVIAFEGTADYLVVNISSPNTPGLRTMQQADRLEPLLLRIGEARRSQHKLCPLLIKIAPDLNEDELAKVAEIALRLKIDGIIVSNTTVTRPHLKSPDAAEEGGLSGRPLFELSTRRLAQLFRLTVGKIPLVGVGGINSGETAWEKFRAGASLIQLYTGLIYEGPGLVSAINHDLARRVNELGISSIGAVIGSGVGDWL